MEADETDHSKEKDTVGKELDSLQISSDESNSTAGGGAPDGASPLTSDTKQSFSTENHSDTTDTSGQKNVSYNPDTEEQKCRTEENELSAEINSSRNDRKSSESETAQNDQSEIDSSANKGSSSECKETSFSSDRQGGSCASNDNQLKTQDNNNSCALADTCTVDQSTPGDAAEVAPSKSTVASDPNTDDVKYANGDSTVTYKQKQDTTESKETKTDPEGSDLGTSINTSDQLQTGSQRETDRSDSPTTTSAAHETRGDKDDTCEGADISSPADSYSASADALESGLENLNSSDGNQNPDTDHGSMGSLNCTSSVSQSKPGAENDQKEAQSEVGNISGLAMSQTKVTQVEAQSEVGNVCGHAMSRTKVTQVEAQSEVGNVCGHAMSRTKVTQVEAQSEVGNVCGHAMSRTKVTQVEAQSEVGNISGLAMSQTKVTEVGKTPEGSQAEGCDSAKKERTQGEMLDTNDKSRSLQAPHTSTDRDQDIGDRYGMQRMAVCKLQCNDTRKLQALGFKEHCEQAFANCRIEFDHADACVVLHSTSDVEDKAKDFMTKFEKKIECIPIESPFVQLLEKEGARSFVQKQIRDEGLHCYWKEKGVGAFCMREQCERCLKRIQKSVCCQTFSVKGEVNADSIVRNVTRDETCGYVNMMHEAKTLQVAATSNVARDVFEKISKYLAPAQSGIRGGRSSTGHEAMQGRDPRHDRPLSDEGRDQHRLPIEGSSSQTKQKQLAVHQACQHTASPPRTRSRTSETTGYSGNACEAPTCEKRHGSAGHTTSNNAKNHQSMTLSVEGNVHSASTGLVTATDQQRTQKVSKAGTQPVLPDKFQIQHYRNSGAAQREQTHCTSESKTTGKSGQHLSNQTPIHDSCENSCNQGRGERPLKLEIQIPELIRNMLKGSKRVREEFVYRLLEKGVCTDPNRLSNGYITVVHFDQDSHQQVARDLVKESFVLIEDIGKDVIDDVEDEIKRLHDETPDLFLYESSKGKGCSTILYYTEILEKVRPLLFKLKYKKLYMHLPGYMWSHLHAVVEDLEKEIKNDPQFRVELEKEMKNDPQFQVRFQIKNNADGAPYVSVTAERAIAAKTEDKMFNLLGKLLFREAQVDPSVDYFRRTEMGQLIKDLERKHQCTINVQTPNQQLLLHAWSPQGHRLMVYEGDMEDADAKVVVLPLWERQKAWPSTHKHILDSAFLSSSIQAFAQLFQSNPEKRTLELDGNEAMAGQKVVLMSVPSNEDNLLKGKVREGLQNVLKGAVSGSTVALPLKLSADIPATKSAKIISFGIVEILDDEKFQGRDILLKLYLEHVTAAERNEICECIDNFLAKKNWATRGCCKSETTNHQRVQVKVDEILKMEGDALVNSTDNDLSHMKGRVSRLLLEKAGDSLTKQCKERYPKGMFETNVAVTDCFNLKFKQIFHIVLPQSQWHEQKGQIHQENQLLESLKACVQSCLTLASAKQFQSIVFPSLGTGQLGYPPQRVASAMFTAAEDFFKAMPDSSLKHVYICCYHKDTDLIKVFKAVETAHNFGVHTAKVKGALFVASPESFIWSKESSVVQIVEGNALTCSCKADVVICATSRQKERWTEYQKHQKCHGIKDTKKTKDEVKKLLESQKALSSIQINLETFDTDHFSDVVQGIAKALHKLPLHVILVAPNQEEFDKVFQLAKAEKNWKEQTHSLTLWGENETGEATPASTPATPNTTAFVQICGQKVQVKAALEELREEVKRRLDSLDSSVDPDHHNQPVKPSDNGDHTKPPPDRQVQGRCTVSIPEDFFEGEIDALLKDSHLSEIYKMKIDHSTHVPSIKFEVKSIEDLDAAVKCVLDCINQRKKKNHSGLNPPQPQPQVHHPEEVTKELDSKAVEALQALMKEDFCKVDVEKTSGNQAKICCRGPAAQETMNRIDSLRQEEVPLSDSDFEKIRDSVDTTAEGVAAYLMPVPDKSRVVIFSFDYNALSKAKHLLNVKLGKVKVTSRSRRRFDGRNTGADSGSTNQSPTHSLDCGSSQPVATGVAKDFTTKSGIKVMVYKTDITKLPVDAIANAANEHLAHGGGVAYAIAKAAGFSLESEGQDYIQRNGPLKVKEVVATTGGSLPCQKVLHAVGPRWSDYKDKAQCQEHLADTVYNCLHKADSMQLASLAIPSISSAIFGVPKDVCARSYLSAVQSFDRQCGDGTCLRQIHFVDVSEDMINVIQQTFTQHWNTDVQPSVARKSSEEKRSQPTSAQEAQQSSGSVTVSPAASTGGIAGESLHHLPATGNSFQAEQDPRIPVLKIFPSSQKGEAEYQFQFCGLDLILLFRQGTVADAKTEAVVLWQEVGSVGRDKNFQQLANSLSQSAWKTVMSLTSEGSIQCVNAGSKILIFPLVSPYAALSEETVQSFVERSVSEADMRGKRSVTIPTFLHTSRGSKECNKELADFATGVYTAVRNYASRPRRFVREIHVIHPDLQVIRSMSEWVQEKAATDMSVVDNKPRERSQSAKTEQAVTCVICHEAVTNPKSLTCGHTFCTHCIDQWLPRASKCPTCNKIQGVLTGKQPPDGRMEMRHSISDLPGYQGCGSLTIKYDFPAGRQTDEHPNPGHRYRPETRVAYLPNTPEGRKVLMLLKTAFDRRLVFTVGQSSTTGHTGIIWNDIHHKTSPFGGSSSYGYPDPDYLKHVQEELVVKGVTEADLTDRQRDFIQNPGKYIKHSQRDFSHHFNISESSETVV